MRAPYRLALALALLALGLLAAGPGAAQGCGSGNGMYECVTVQWTYRIRAPEVADPLHRFPVVVIFHDAGGSGQALVDDDRLIAGFIDKGYAVLAPDGLRRHNLRFRSYQSKARAASPVSGLANSGAGVDRSDKTFPMADADGGVRTLRYEQDTGWYYYNIDLATFGARGGRTETDYLGRDEIAFLRWALEDAAARYLVDPDPVLIIGLGHGASLVWQIACHAPRLARLLAPVGGAYWEELPAACRPGADLVHTHHRASAFWPLEGAGSSRRRYGRTPVGANLEMLLRANRCLPALSPIRDDHAGATRTRWTDCTAGGPVELILLDRPFAFQPWWLNRIHDRLDAFDLPQPFDSPDLPVETGPRFSRPGEAPGPAAAAPDGDAEARAEPPAEPTAGAPGAETASRFKAPGAGTGSRFKSAGDRPASRFKRVD